MIDMGTRMEEQHCHRMLQRLRAEHEAKCKPYMICCIVSK